MSRTCRKTVNGYAVSLALAVGLLAGCSSMKPYPNTLEKNLQIRTATTSGSFFSSVRAQALIYRVDAQCQTHFEGTVDLDAPTVAVGIPIDRLSYLEFTFKSSAFLSNSSSSISQGTLLRPRPGYRYDLDVSYENNIYNVVVRENHPRTRAKREIFLASLNTCKAGGQRK